jgi:hypothetical protein
MIDLTMGLANNPFPKAEIPALDAAVTAVTGMTVVMIGFLEVVY